MRVEVDSTFGNVTHQSSNASYIGPIALWLYQKVPSYEIQMTFTTEAGKLIMKNTMKPCIAKGTQKLFRLIDSVMKGPNGNFSETSSLVCPMEKVKKFYFFL